MLKIENLKKEYPDFILDCSMEVKKGYITGFVGKNGAGKTTTIKSILNLLHRDGGTIQLFGKGVEFLDKRDWEKIGVVLNDSGFSGYFTLKDVMAVLRCAYPCFDGAKFRELATKFQLPDMKKLRDYSTGMMAKLKILIALSHEADFLILDEPTIGLDVSAREEILALIRDYMTDDRAVMISSHISTDLENLCDDVYLIDQGKIILHEDTDVLLSDYGMIKISEEEYEKLDKTYLLHTQKKEFGMQCLTNQKKFYQENYPKLVIEKGNIDDLILMTGGEKE